MFGAFWGPERPLWHHFGGHLVQGCTQEGPCVSKGGFSLIFDGSLAPHWGRFWIAFSYFI